MGKIFKSYVHYISTKFPSIFLKYLRNRLQTSELEKSSIYKIAKIAHDITNLDDLYKAIHKNISNLMYAENIFFASKKYDMILIRLIVVGDRSSYLVVS